MPDESTVRVWAEDGPFAERYQHARALGYQRMADEIIEIADSEPDAQTARNRCDVRKWYLSKMLPKVFGEKIEVDNKGGLVIVKLDAEDMKA